MLTSIEIAQQADLRHMRRFMEDLDLTDDDFEFYGKYTGKIRLRTLDRFADRPDGKLILVTAMTPTRSGEGKTLTTVGLGQALGTIGKRGMITLREPSLGPVFGIKGGAAGGGYAQVLPMERINLHFNGDIHAISAAHNLLAAMVDNHLHQGNALGLDMREVLWPRAVDMNDRALRQVVVGLGGRLGGIPRESGYVITAASEIMAILALASSRSDLKRRLGHIAVGFRQDGTVVTADDLDAAGAMAVILNEAIMPNLVQTMEHTPALVHAGPFANIAHGTSSILSARIARKLADYVVTEAGFGADLGAEKFFNIVNRYADLWPSAVVVVATCRAIKYHGGADALALNEEDMDAFERGLGNLRAHVANMKRFGVPVIVAINRFPFDTEAELHRLRDACEAMEVPCAAHEAFARGGSGAVELAEKTVALADASNHQEPRFLYPLDDSVEDKIERIATTIYGADAIYLEKQAQQQIDRLTALGYGDLPICIAKTQASLSDDRTVRGVPEGWTLTVTDVQLSAGAGFLVVVCGNMMLMPGLPSRPAAVDMDVDDTGQITGLF
ncbi:MAG: formate--tetrahydrofolate ligase [Bacteroidetes bacterium]|jgi:formate--tetrahydrofolate ligase|nr:formate--tetrahydrofolate ligase [Bacteroidota bacterium]